jgi:transcriptional regulator with XRE-family HTH domain
MMRATRPLGDLLRDWRQRRRMSQLDLACEADISTKHLSFLETGRSTPSRDMLLRLAETLDIPLRERNVMLVAAGYAPMFRERSIDDPGLRIARRSIDLILQAQEPFPALAVDRHWTLVAANKAVSHLIAGVDSFLMIEPVNVLRLSLHPAGLAPRVANLAQWRRHVIARLRRQIDLTGDPVLNGLLEEIRDYPPPPGQPSRQPAPDYDGVAVPFQLVTIDGTLSFLSTTTVFGTPVDITLSELAIESFFPADAATADLMRRLSEGFKAGSTALLQASG